MLVSLTASLLALASLSAAQTTMVTIQVGSTASAQGGIFQFIPPTVTASNGTIVNFQFTGIPGNHSITQSAFSDPCDPLPGGFDSGWVLIPQSGGATPQFNLTITNDQEPIWFYCKQLAPAPHCPVGMVGAINPPTSGNTFSNFQANAMAFSGVPGQGQNGLVGVGASASASVGPIPSGDTFFTGAPFSSSGSASGGASATSPGSSPTATTSNGASLNVVANPFAGFLAALIGITLV